jgi:hypothetical protein
VAHPRRITAAVAVVFLMSACGSAPEQPTFIGAPSTDATAEATTGPSAELSGTLAPSPSAKPSATPSVKPSAKPDLPTGKPSAATTGVPKGTVLKRIDGDQTYAKAGQVVQNVDIHGYVTIKASNVVIRNAIIRGGAARCNAAVVNVASGSVTIERSEIAPAHPNACLDGVWAANATLRRMNIHGTVDGVKANSNVLIEDSYIHDLSWYASDPNQGGGATHNDDVQTLSGSHITLRRNVLVALPKGNAAYQVTQDFGAVSDLRIEHNWLDGGGCTLNFAHKVRASLTGIYVVGNRFGRHSTFQCPILVSTKTTLSADSANVWDDTGKPIPSPQRHD